MNLKKKIGASLRLYILSGCLLILLATTILKLGRPDRFQSPLVGSPLENTSINLPELEVSHLVTADALSGRNPFSFRETPKPISRPMPLPKVDVTNEEPINSKKSIPTSAAIRFGREYLGFLGPKYRRVAVFRINGEVNIATRGDVLGGTISSGSLTKRKSRSG